MTTLPARILCGAAVVVAATGAAVLGAPPASAAAADTTFITSNEQTNLAEIAIGNLALSKAQTAQARQLATMTISDHKTTMARLKQVASALNVTLPTAPSAEQQQQAAELMAAPDSSFDALYGQIQVAGHNESIAGTDTEISSGSDSSVVAYARYYLPIATRHLDMARALVTATGGDPDAVPAGTGGMAATTSRSTSDLETGVLVGGSVVVLVGGAALVARRRRVRI